MTTSQRGSGRARAGRTVVAGAILATAATALAAVPAHAEIITFGAQLESAVADKALSHQQDTVLWNATGPGGGALTVPAAGQILSVELKGKALEAPNGRKPDHRGVYNDQPAPANTIHFQTLTPEGGTMRVVATSQEHYMPFGGDVNEVTSFPLDKVRLCTNAGESIALNTVGGWDGDPDPSKNGYTHGVPFQVFQSGTAGGAFYKFHGHGKTGTGATLADGAFGMPGPERVDGETLLMRVTMGTGPHANQVCGGDIGKPPPKQAAAPKVQGPAPIQLARIPDAVTKLTIAQKKRIASLSLFCSKATTAPCQGTASMAYDFKKKLKAKKGKKAKTKIVTVDLGSAAFNIDSGQTGKVEHTLSKSALRKLLARNPSKITVTALTAPGKAGDARYTSERKLTVSYGKKKD